MIYLLNNEPCDPKNRNDIKFVIDFEERNRISEFEISIQNLIFANNDKLRIHQWLQTYGRFHGMPFDIVFSTGQTLRYYIDFTDESTTWNSHEFNANVKRYRANLNFFDNADSLIWRAISWQPSDFTNIKYIIVPEQQPLYFITLSLAVFSTAQQIAQSIEDIQAAIADLTEATTPSFAGPVPVVNFGQILSAIIRLTARIIRTIFLTIAMIQLIQRIIEMVMPKVRTMLDIPYLRLLEKGCNHLGYQLDVTAISELAPLSFLGQPERELSGGIFREIFMPLSFAYTNGFPSEMDSIRTLKEAIERIEELFNLRTTVNNGVVKIEPRLVDGDTPPIPIAYNEQERAEMQTRFNNEFWKRKILMWTKDVKDMWTFDDKKGHLAEFDTSVINFTDPNLRLLKGMERVNNPFSLGSRKTELTRVEKFLKNVLAPVVDIFTGGAFSSQINDRIGVLVVSSQYFTNNKLLWKVGDKIHPNHRDILNARRILTVYHGSESVINRNKEVIENMPIRMNEQTFLLLSSQNVVNLSDGTQAELVRLEWSENDAEASATLLINTEYNTNIIQTVTYGAGY